MKFQFFNHSWNFNRTFNNTALIWAALKGHTEVVQLLLTKGDIDVNIKNIKNNIHFMAFKSNFFYFI